MSNTVYRTTPYSLEQVDSSSREKDRVVTSMAPVSSVHPTTKPPSVSQDTVKPSSLPPPIPQDAIKSSPSPIPQDTVKPSSLPPPIPQDAIKSSSLPAPIPREVTKQASFSSKSDSTSLPARPSAFSSLMEEVRASGGRVKSSEQVTRRSRVPPPLPQSAVPTMRTEQEDDQIEVQHAKSLPAALPPHVSSSHAIKPAESHARSQPPPPPPAAMTKDLPSPISTRSSAPMERVPPPPPSSAPPIRGSHHSTPPPPPPSTPPPQRGLASAPPPLPSSTPPLPSSTPPARGSLSSIPPPLPSSTPPPRSPMNLLNTGSRNSLQKNAEESRSYPVHDDKTKLFGGDNKTRTLKDKRKELGKTMLS